MSNIVDTWENVLDILKKDMMETLFNTWIEPIIPVDMTADKISLLVPYEYSKQIIETRYSSMIKDALFLVTKKDYELEVIVKSPLATVEKVGKSIIIKQEVNVNVGMHLNPMYTFDTFVTGKSNQIAHAIAKNIAQCITEGKTSEFNPLFLHGGVGLGKTHLMNAICHDVLRKKPETRILYTTSEQFTNDLVNSIKDDRTQDFRDKYRTVDILLIDDIQFFGGKENIQEEFFHTFNELYQQNKHIVITSDRPPKELYTLEERLRTRFECSGIHEISSPDFETRIAILKKKADNLGVEIPENIYRYIAENITSNIRELEGAIKMLKSYHILMNSEITEELTKEVLKNFSIKENEEITLEYIVDSIEKYFNLNPNELLSNTRSRKIAYPRQISMYIMREITKHSLSEIGAFFDMDHSTIIHGINKIKKDMENDRATKNLVDNIINNIKN